MQIEHDLTVIAERAQRIGLSLPQVAQRAGVAASTLYRGRAGGSTDIKVSTIRVVNEALAKAERDLLADLIRLHPDLAGPPAGAALPVVNSPAGGRDGQGRSGGLR